MHVQAFATAGRFAFRKLGFFQQTDGEPAIVTAILIVTLVEVGMDQLFPALVANDEGVRGVIRKDILDVAILALDQHIFRFNYGHGSDSRKDFLRD